VVVVLLSGSVALLADTIHNFADVATAIPLAVAFWFGRKKPTVRFTFGYGRVEDLAGVAIALTILASAIVARYQSIQRLLHLRTYPICGRSQSTFMTPCRCIHTVDFAGGLAAPLLLLLRQKFTQLVSQDTGAECAPSR
jgi:cation diffusion facilitator family transporter